MTILQKVFMLRTPDGIVEKVSIQDWAIDCANYISRSGVTFNGCFQMKNGDLVETRGLYRLYNDPVFNFLTRGKMTRDMDVMKDLIKKFLREFNIGRGLIYYDNFKISVYDAYRKAVLLEDTPFYEQGHLYVYRLNIPIDLGEEQKTVEEKAFNHKIVFSSAVNVYYNILDDFRIKPGYGFLIQKSDDDPVRIASPDHGEAEVALPAGLWLFVHSPPTQVD